MPDIKKELKENYNAYNYQQIRDFLTTEVISEQDLRDIGIPEKIVEYLGGRQQANNGHLYMGNRALPASTELYFWGIPDSGKSCALGAVLSTLRGGPYDFKAYQSNGARRLRTLSSMFTKKGKVAMLPPGTEPNAVADEMQFTIKDKKGYCHPITCFDLAGEWLRILSQDDNERVKALQETFSSHPENRKIHFFVIEHGADRTQGELLFNAVGYIEDKKLFEELTDAIYIIVTKADNAGPEDDRLENIKNYLLDSGYQEFYKRLIDICDTKEINGGEVGIIPFSVGEIYFKTLCVFDPADAKVVAELLLRDTGTDGPANPVLRSLWKFFKN